MNELPRRIDEMIAAAAADSRNAFALAVQRFLSPTPRVSVRDCGSRSGIILFLGRVMNPAAEA